MLSTLAACLILGGTLGSFILAVGILAWKKQQQVPLWKIDTDFVSARGSQKWPSIGLSLFAGAMGSWCLTAPAETAAIGGCWALIGYAVAMSIPWTLFLWAGPQMRKIMGDKGFTALEFLQERHGRPVQLVVAAGSILTMWVFLVAELSAIGSCLKSLSPSTPSAVATFSTAAATMAYSTFGGLGASLLTDKIQGVMTTILIITCYTATFTEVSPSISSHAWSSSFNWDSEGIIIGLSLTLGALFVELLNQATWQRVFASKNETHMRLGFIFGIILVFFAMIVFGLVGNFAKAAALSNFIEMEEGEEYNSLFLLLAKLNSQVWLGIVLILATSLVASSVDSLQIGLSAMIASDLIKNGKSLNWARLVCILLNIPAVIFATFNPPSILELLVAGNVVSTAIGPAMILAFSSRMTSNGILGGIILGLISVPCIGWWRTKSFNDGLKWFLFPNGYNWECLLTFFVEMVVTIIFSILISLLEKRLRPHKLDEQGLNRTDDNAGKEEGIVKN